MRAVAGILLLAGAVSFCIWRGAHTDAPQVAREAPSTLAPPHRMPPVPVDQDADYQIIHPIYVHAEEDPT